MVWVGSVPSVFTPQPQTNRCVSFSKISNQSKPMNFENRGFVSVWFGFGTLDGFLQFMNTLLKINNFFHSFHIKLIYNNNKNKNIFKLNILFLHISFKSFYLFVNIISITNLKIYNMLNIC